MLGYILRPEGAQSAAVDQLLDALAQALGAEGVALGGGVQSAGQGPGCRAEMRLRLLGSGEERVISQPLGSGAEGCRLDSGALELAVEAMSRRLPAARLVILNKFGKQEAAGRGVRPLVAHAMVLGLPVLLSVSPEVLDEFRSFAGGLAEAVAPEGAEAWCRGAMAAA
ncbi:DUF2478 domain-containing protein [Paracoccus sp. S-4012]|uniref:DUF2478 domain-containing protein n=1 Tax=Paracoccus sp. S-4012 TaxID=2665648 RepID=UPI0012B0F8A6|nr:DUF2478 domain-containing protein [Paracoccus sp. S-4012]MRX49149.1 DUF2478 domain-containing protein [Paracoccus sp. S-4012]